MDFDDKAEALMRHAASSGEPVFLPCDSHGQADHYRRRFYEVRRRLRLQPSSRAPVWEAFTFRIHDAEDGSADLAIAYDPSPIDVAVSRLREGEEDTAPSENRRHDD